MKGRPRRNRRRKAAEAFSALVVMGDQYQHHQHFSSPLFPNSQHAEHSPEARSFQSLEPEDKLRALQEIQQLKDKVMRFALKYSALQRENESLRSRIQPLEAKAQMVDQLKEHLQDVKTKLSVEQRKRLALQASLVQSRERRWGQQGQSSDDGREERAVNDDAAVATSEAVTDENKLEQSSQTHQQTQRSDTVQFRQQGSSPAGSPPFSPQHHPAARAGAEADVEAFRASAAAHLEAVKAARRKQTESSHGRRERQSKQQNDRVEQSSSNSSRNPPREFYRKAVDSVSDDISRREENTRSEAKSSPPARRGYGWMKKPRS